jgi:hypothetical protein
MIDNQKSDIIFNQITAWDNLRLAYCNAARGGADRDAAQVFNESKPNFTISQNCTISALWNRKKNP